MLLPPPPSSSSKVTMSRLLCVLAHCAYASRWVCIHVSPVEIEQSCMSLHRFGTTHDTVGSWVKSVGNALTGWLDGAGTLLRLTHGLCLRAYWPDVHTVDPADGRSSEYPVKESPAAISCAPELAVPNVCGQ